MAAAKETCPLHCKDQIALRLSCMSAGGSWTKASMHSGGSVVISVVKTALSKPRALNAEQALPYTSVGPSCAFVMQIQIVHCNATYVSGKHACGPVWEASGRRAHFSLQPFHREGDEKRSVRGPVLMSSIVLHYHCKHVKAFRMDMT